MDVKEKLLTRYRLAVTIQKIISNNFNGSDKSLVTSLRKLAASSQIEYAIIQKITSSKKDPQFSTLIAITDGFGISFSKFSEIFDSVSEQEIEQYKSSLKDKSKQKKSYSLKTKGAKKNTSKSKRL